MLFNAHTLCTSTANIRLLNHKSISNYNKTQARWPILKIVTVMWTNVCQLQVCDVWVSTDNYLLTSCGYYWVWHPNTSWMYSPHLAHIFIGKEITRTQAESAECVFLSVIGVVVAVVFHRISVNECKQIQGFFFPLQFCSDRFHTLFSSLCSRQTVPWGSANKWHAPLWGLIPCHFCFLGTKRWRCVDIAHCHKDGLYYTILDYFRLHVTRFLQITL